MASPGDYQHFKGVVPQRKIQVGMHQNKHFRYYEFGPKRLDPLICLGGAACTADCFYKQVLALSSKGYRVMAVDAPALWSHAEWMSAFDKFLDSLRINQVHLYGTSLGGFLCQLYAAYRPRRVKSLVLSNTFVDTKPYHDEYSWNSLFQWTPEFMLKRIIMAGLGEGYREAHIANSIDFVVSQLETLHQQELASRLTLMSQLSAVGTLHLPDDNITIMDTNDYCSVRQDSRDALYIRYPGARRAFLKSGGDFPFLSRADEVNLHLQLHLRRVGEQPEGPDNLPSPSTTQQGMSSPRYNSNTATTSKENEVSKDARTKNDQAADPEEGPAGGHRHERGQPPGEEVDSVGGQLAYKKDPLWAALADAEASVWEDGGGAQEKQVGRSEVDHPSSPPQQGAQVQAPSGVPAKRSVPEGAENGSGTDEVSASQQRQEEAAVSRVLPQSEEEDSEFEDKEGWRKEEGADPLLWGTHQRGSDEDKAEGAGDPLSQASSTPAKVDVPDTLARRRSAVV